MSCRPGGTVHLFKSFLEMRTNVYFHSPVLDFPPLSSFLFLFKQQYVLSCLANEMQVSFEDRWTGLSWRGNLGPRTREDAIKA